MPISTPRVIAIEAAAEKRAVEAERERIAARADEIREGIYQELTGKGITENLLCGALSRFDVLAALDSDGEGEHSDSDGPEEGRCVRCGQSVRGGGFVCADCGPIMDREAAGGFS